MISVRAQYDSCNDDIRVVVIDKTPEGCLDNLGRLVFAPVERGQLFDPTLRMTRAAALVLMDELWQAGVRPTEQGTVGQLAAVSYHLEDMRKLVFLGTRA